MRKVETEQIYRSYKYMLMALKKEWSASKEPYRNVTISKEESVKLSEYIQEFTMAYNDSETKESESIMKDLKRTKKASLVLRLAKKLSHSINVESNKAKQYKLVLDKDEFELFVQIMEGDYDYELFD